MARDRVEIRLRTTTAEAIQSLQRVNRDLERTEANARETQREVREAQQAGQRLRARGAAFRQNVLRTQRRAGPGVTLTSEGLQAGVFKFSDQGFMVEGLAARAGGAALVAAAGGRIIGGLSQGLVHTRDLLRRGVDPLEATLGVAANRTVDVGRGILNAFGVEQTIAGLSALVGGRSIESVKADLDDVANKVKAAFLPSLKKEAEKALQEELKAFRERTELDLLMANEATFLSWHLPPAALSNIRADVARATHAYVGGQSEKQEKRLRDQQALSTVGAGY